MTDPKTPSRSLQRRQIAATDPNRELSGIEEIRRARNVFATCIETFNDRYTAEELIKIYRAYRASNHDILPDMWETRQLERAILLGHAPSWDLERRPIYNTLALPVRFESRVYLDHEKRPSRTPRPMWVVNAHGSFWYYDTEAEARSAAGE